MDITSSQADPKFHQLPVPRGRRPYAPPLLSRAQAWFRYSSAVILTALVLDLYLILVSGYLAGPLIRAALGAVVWPVFYARTASVALLLALGAVLFLVLPRAGRPR